jgi:hypothetical protein
LFVQLRMLLRFRHVVPSTVLDSHRNVPAGLMVQTQNQNATAGTHFDLAKHAIPWNLLLSGFLVPSKAPKVSGVP